MSASTFRASLRDLLLYIVGQFKPPLSLFFPLWVESVLARKDSSFPAGRGMT